MAGLVYDFIDVIEKEIEYYDMLIDHAKDKTQIIINNEVEKLQEVTSSEQLITSKLLKAEKQREVLLEDICLVLNIPSKNCTIDQLVEKIKNSMEESEKLINIKNKVTDKISELKKLNDKNRILIDQSIEFINFTLNAVQSKRDVQGNSYQYGGALMENSRQNSFFDTKQ